MSWTQLKTESEMHSKEKAMYENPLLEEDDITIQVFDNVDEATVDAEAAAASEELTSGLGLFQNSDNIGQLLGDLDEFLSNEKLPAEDSMSIKALDELMS